jgi:hypothetical protein
VSESDGSADADDDSGQADAPDVEATEPPQVVEVSPLVGSTAGGTRVFVEGGGFGDDVEVWLGGVRMGSVDRIDAYQLTFVTEPAPSGPATVKVVSGGRAAQFETPFVFESDLALVEVDPASGPLDGGNEAVVRGAGFSARTRFVVGEREAEVVRLVSDAEAVIEVPGGPAPGPADVTAFDHRAVFGTGLYTYEARPRLDALLPDRGRPAGGEEVRIEGAGVTDGCMVYFGSEPVPASRDRNGFVVVTTPPLALGSYDVSVDCPGRGADWLAEAFTVAEVAAPAVTGVFPESGFTRGGELISVLGSGLELVSSATIGGNRAIVLGASRFRVELLTPPGVAGIADITLTSARGTLELDAGFTYVALPVFGRVTPSGGDADAGWSAELVGTGLGAVDALVASGVELPVTSRSGSRIAFDVPGMRPGTAPLFARVGRLQLDTGIRLSWLRASRFDGFSPTSGPVSGGTRILIAGDGFTAGCAVFIDGVAAETTVIGTSLIAAVAPPHEEEKVEVEVRGCGERTVLPERFRYDDPTQRGGGTGGGSIEGEVRVTVLELGTNVPIPNATVMVQLRSSSPYVGFTNEAGQITFTGDDLYGPQTITAFATDRSTESIIGVDARDVTLMLNQLPPPPCTDPTDPACAPPAPEPTGTLVGFVTGLDKIGVPPPGTQPMAVVSTTTLYAGWANPDPGPEAIRWENGPFTITTRVGDYAAIVLCGYGTPDVASFVPLRIGVTRYLTQRPGGEPVRATIDCSIPLTSRLTVKLSGAPDLYAATINGAAFPAQFGAHIGFNFGPEGYFEGLRDTVASTPTFDIEKLPLLQGVLDSVTVEVRAGAYPASGQLPQAISYAVGIRSYDRMITLPDLVGVPRFTVPADGVTSLAGGYVEWTLGPAARRPDFYNISASAANAGFSRWNIYIPGSATSFNFADFPEFSALLGGIPAPTDPTGSIYLYVRAIDADIFDFNDFSRRVFRQSGWRSSSTNYRSLVFAAP